MNTDRNKTSDFARKLAESFNDVSTTASVYAKISIVKELIISLEVKLRELEKILEQNNINEGR